MFHSVDAFLQDFGEYQESYYSVQTTEGEQISQLIAGYIDIILKKVRHSSLETRNPDVLVFSWGLRVFSFAGDWWRPCRSVMPL